ncbi:type II CAAX endopeptidase family protein [uncultured Jannaschia sp.]|uniref:CPBP family intramembrane glutamic endopeptidase n=1 Tax=uncultured Jannaschia sp. TaxID=293347 RepID=UPI0026086427|nr:type II CAAX endopeptidase family protein [uncultured Jannaschia sp.]
MWTHDFARFVAPARAHPALWRLAVGLVLILAVYALTVAALIAGLAVAAGPDGGSPARFFFGDTPESVLVLLGSFAGMFTGPLLVVRWFHRAAPATLFGARPAATFALAATITALVFLATLLLPAPFDAVRQTPAGTFLLYLAPALAGILLQTGAEELVFRGYLQPQLAARFSSPLVWMLVPALVFGGLHYDPATAGANTPWIVAAAVLFGLVAADLTRVTGGIGAAWGVHFVNNASAILILALEGSLSGLALWRTPFGADDMATLPPMILHDMLVTVIVWLSIRLWLARDGGAARG